MITYTYDPLYHLTVADYSTGKYFHYSYDAVGNRLSQSTHTGTTTYIYDAANRLASANDTMYNWDNNGNLVSDGSSTYSYNAANRLIQLMQGGSTYSFAYNGQGDRLSQTVNNVTTRYTLDLNAGLTQVLSDGSYTYLYANGRVVQKQVHGDQLLPGRCVGQRTPTVGYVGQRNISAQLSAIRDADRCLPKTNPRVSVHPWL